jgi:hypothetical protein
MTKFVTTLLFAILAALGMYMARRRILFALKTGAIVYVVLLFARLLLAVGSIGDHMDDLIWPAVLVLIAWTVLWWISTTYAHRKDAQRRLRRASSTGRTAR